MFVAAFVGVAVFSSAIFAQSSPSGKHTGSVVLPLQAVDAERPVVRGQNEPAEKKGPTFFERVKRTLSNIAKDKDGDEENYDPPKEKEKVRETPRTQAIPTTPPKPVTSQDVRKAIDNPESVAEKRPQPQAPAQNAATPKATEPARETAAETTQPSQVAEIASSSNESIYKRLESIRSQVFVDTVPDTAAAAKPAPSAAPTNPRPTTTVVPAEPERNVAATPTVERRQPPSSPIYSQETTFRERPVSSAPNRVMQNELPEQSQPAPTRRIAMSTVPVDNDPWGSNDAQPVQESVKQEMKPLAGIDVVRKPSDSPWNKTERPTNTAIAKPQRTLETVDPQPESPKTESFRMEVAQTPDATSQRSGATFSSDREKSLLVSPLIELETVGASKVIVGQEAAYQIRVVNRGGAAAEQVVLTVEIPNWIDVLPPDVSAGTTSIVPRGPNSELRDFVWKIARVEARAEEQVVLHLVPRQRQTVDLKIRYDFRKPSAGMKIAVQEPTLEMELQGPGEVLWGSKVGYKLLVRNTGNGDAENVKLELLQTGSDMKSCELPMLKAGDEQVIDVDVWTGKQDHVDINIQATGPYDLTASVVKRVVVMRPDLSVQVEAPEMQFVGNPAEFTVRVRNNGTATAKNVELAATIPLGAKYVSNTSGGRLTPQNQVLWNIEAIPNSGEFVATVVCEMKREGTCKLEAAANDKSGLLAGGVGSVNVESIADLKMQLENPQGPIEVGQEAVYTITIMNRGTKTAEDVEVVAAFARGLDPFAIEGGNGVMNDGQVIFDKIPAISAGQTLTLKVKGKADRPGNHRIRAEVICNAVNAHLVYEQATYFYIKKGGKSAFMAESPNGAGFSSNENPTTPPSIQHTTTSQPLQTAPSTANRAAQPSPLR